MTLLTDEVADAIGREVTYTAPEPLGRAALRYFALAVGDRNPIYTDGRAAREAGYRDVVAPPTFVCETNQYLDGEVDADGYIGHRWELPLPVPTRTIRGGHTYELLQPVHPDHRLTVTWRVEDIVERTSSRGDPLLLVTSLAEYRDQDGELLARNRETIIHQPLPAEGAR